LVEQFIGCEEVCHGEQVTVSLSKITETYSKYFQEGSSLCETLISQGVTEFEMF
jgi:hypothetical protein